MEICGIKFAPLLMPMERRLQTLAAAIWITIILLGVIVWPVLTLCLLYTRYWWLLVLYLFWIWVIDKETGEQGGRQFKWVRSWMLWKYSRDYFPLSLEKVPGVAVDPKKNYLFCCFPHGLISIGCFHAFATESLGFSKLFPHHTPYIVSLYQNFYIPFLRDLALAVGGISSSAKSIDYVLGLPQGGHICVLIVGGAVEAFNCKPGSYKLFLKSRRGFVRLALKNGTPLVPVLSFGETDLYDQLEEPRLRKVQQALMKIFRVALVVPIGRGFFQYSFGMLPRRRKVTTVVGVPMEVPKLANPTAEQVDHYHEQFVMKLNEMFEEQKFKYLDDPKDKHLIVG